ncbi:MAG: PrgI family protein [Parcubacteria group bacterium]|jgi:hypothetical protein
MQANVPQFIDIEDKIAFGLSGKQLLWIGVMAAVLLVAYNLFDRELFFVAGFLIIAVFGALAFWRPQGVSLIAFLGFVMGFTMRPKSYVWKRSYRGSEIDMKRAVSAQRRETGSPVKGKGLPGRSQLRKIAWALDTKK